jgi:Fur family iron response transcriptional regulator
MAGISDKDSSDLAAFLRSRKVTPTTQRIQIGRILFPRKAHFSAEDVYNAVNKSEPKVSKATVYNTLGLFVRRGLIREVLVDPSKVFYDSNTAQHHHMYDIDTGEIQDIGAEQISLKHLPELPSGKCIDSMEVVVRIRNK